MNISGLINIILLAVFYYRCRKIMVDIMSEPLLFSSKSEAEYPVIYMDIFEWYIVDKNSLIRYVNSRKSIKKIRNIVKLDERIEEMFTE